MLPRPAQRLHPTVTATTKTTATHPRQAVPSPLSNPSPSHPSQPAPTQPAAANQFIAARTLKGVTMAILAMTGEPKGDGCPPPGDTSHLHHVRRCRGAAGRQHSDAAAARRCHFRCASQRAALRLAQGVAVAILASAGGPTGDDCPWKPSVTTQPPTQQTHENPAACPRQPIHGGCPTDVSHGAWSAQRHWGSPAVAKWRGRGGKEEGGTAAVARTGTAALLWRGWQRG